MDLSRQDVLRIAMKHCRFVPEGDYYPREFECGDAVIDFVRECIEANNLLTCQEHRKEE